MVEIQREWQIVEHPESAEIERLQKEVENLHPLISALLLQRGLRSFDQLKGFFNPTVAQIEAYGEMKDQAKAVENGLNVWSSEEEISAMCQGCHNEESPTFKGFNFAEMYDQIKHNIPSD